MKLVGSLAALTAELTLPITTEKIRTMMSREVMSYTEGFWKVWVSFTFSVATGSPPSSLGRNLVLASILRIVRNRRPEACSLDAVMFCVLPSALTLKDIVITIVANPSSDLNFDGSKSTNCFRTNLNGSPTTLKVFDAVGSVEFWLNKTE